MEITFEPVLLSNIDTYIKIGIIAYKEHYLHLWEEQNPSPFINAYLNKEVILTALKDPKQLFYIIKADRESAGILNITIDSEKEHSIAQKNLLLNKIYLLKSYSVKGIGSKTLDFVNDLARKKEKSIICLYAMKKGKPLDFYKKHGYTIIKEVLIDLPNIIDTEKEMWLMTKQV